MMYTNFDLLSFFNDFMILYIFVIMYSTFERALSYEKSTVYIWYIIIINGVFPITFFICLISN